MMNPFLSSVQKRWLTHFVLLLGLVFSGSVYARFIAVSVSAEDNFRNLITNNIERAVDEVGDEDDRHPLTFELPHHLEESIGFMCVEA